MTDSGNLTVYFLIVREYLLPKLVEMEHVNERRLTKGEAVAVNALSQILSPSECV